MTERNTSAVYTAWRVLENLLQAATFPTSASAGGPPMVFFGDPDLPPEGLPLSSERIAVIPAIDTPTEDWGPAGNGARDEQFRLIVQVLSAIPGSSTAAARDRLEQLTATVERTVRATMLGPVEDRPDEFSQYPFWQWAPISMVPLLALSPEGTVGRAEITIDCQVRINTVPPT